jgi:hypothetical protein
LSNESRHAFSRLAHIARRVLIDRHFPFLFPRSQVALGNALVREVALRPVPTGGSATSKTSAFPRATWERGNHAEQTRSKRSMASSLHLLTACSKEQRKKRALDALRAASKREFDSNSIFCRASLGSGETAKSQGTCRKSRPSGALERFSFELASGVSAMSKVAVGIAGADGVEGCPDGRSQCFLGPRGRFAQAVLELAPSQFDGVEVG